MSRGKQFFTPEETRAAFWSKVKKEEDGCWTWQAGKNSEGYGRFRYQGKNCRAHRVAWIWANGLIPEGLQLDHLCRNRACVNPEHLEPVTHRENLLRGEGACAINARKTHCIRGHPLSGKNLYVSPRGGRLCRACDRVRATKHPVTQ